MDHCLARAVMNSEEVVATAGVGLAGRLRGLRMCARFFLIPWHSFVPVFSNSACLEVNSSPVEQESHVLCSDRRVCGAPSMSTECEEGVAEKPSRSSGPVSLTLGPRLSALGL